MQKILFLSLLLLILQPLRAFAACGTLSLSHFTTSVSLNSNNFQTLNFRVNRTSNGSCNYYVTINNGGASAYNTRVMSSGTNTYPIQFYNDSGRTQIIKSRTEAGSSTEVISGSFSGNNSQANDDYKVYIDTTVNNYLRFGTYSKSFTFTVYSGTFNTNSPADTETVTYTYTQGKHIDISLVATGAAYDSASTTQTMNFGTLATGAAKAFDVVMQHNAGYNLSMKSLNAGKIKNTASPVTIPYTITVNGTPVTLTTTFAVVKTATGVSPTTGTRLPVNVTIGSLANTTPGTYTDTVSFSVASSE